MHVFLIAKIDILNSHLLLLIYTVYILRLKKEQNGNGKKIQHAKLLNLPKVFIWCNYTDI